MKQIKIAIFGGSGYGGSELLRILLAHPNAEIVLVTANEHAGKPVSEVHKNLRGVCDLTFDSSPYDLPALDCDVAFLALPHGQALRIVPQLADGIKVIDLSGDFRIDDKTVFEKFYKLEHTADELQNSFVYGLTEINRNAIREAKYIANPGCFATATLLALAPLVKAGLPVGRIIVDAKTGSSGSGAKPAANTHHPQRMTSFYAYKPFTHQHVPEIGQHLRSIGKFANELVFMTHSLPVSRGIFASCYAEAGQEISTAELKAIYADFYHPKSEIPNPKSQVEPENPFIRIVEGSPDINWVKTTNFCDISVHAHGRQIAVFSAIDNLVKGAAGQAVQNMNLMFGLDETTGLKLIGTNP
ncbi:MAG: N-acetyl-gamma-glutamyl-phosphate reductase [Acidobacteria bacterium]|nr:N-acetyl-gamma-glutamyl-phosphate reductase [Acidobacteriota bacterium]